MKQSTLLLGLIFILSSCSYQNKDTDLVPTKVVPSRLQIQSMESVPLRKQEVDGSYTTTLSNYIDLARITSPELDNSFGDVQATAVDVKDNRAYVVYNTSGDEIGGAIDILNISDISNPQILNTYLSKQYEFSSLVVRNNLLYAAGYQKDQGAIVMILSVQGDELSVVSVKKVVGTYATDISLFGNKLLVMTGESGGVTEFLILNDGSLSEANFVTASNGLSLSTNGYFNFYVDGSSKTNLTSQTSSEFQTVFPELTVKPSYVKEISGAKNKAPTRIKVKNSLLYSFDTVSNQLKVIDISQAGKTGQLSAMSTIGQLNSSGTANGFDLDQQKAFLAMGEKGVGVGSLVNPKLPQFLGYFAFPSDNGSANNVWSKISATGNKYLFIAYGRQGLRIISEQPVNGSDKNVVVYAKGDADLGENAKYQLKINGQVVKTQEVDGDYKAYTYTHTSPLSSNDIVEVIFINDNGKLNPLQKRNLFVNYLWVGDHFCYQDTILTKGTLNNYGLFENGDSVASNKGKCETKKSSTPVCSITQHLENNICVNNIKECTVANGSGTQTWSQVGGWGECIANVCESHCSLVNGLCLPKVCEPNSTLSCTVENGTGLKTCALSGQSYGSCVPSTCNNGYSLVNGLCQLKNIIPANAVVHIIKGGSLLHTVTGFIDPSNLPLSIKTVAVSTGTAVVQSGKLLITPPPTFVGTYIISVAMENTVGSSATGQIKVIVDECVVGTNLACTTSTNFNGTKTCGLNGNEWLSYGTCTSSGSCCSGHYLNNGSCTPQVCTPNSTQSCSITNGTGTKTCNSSGSAYGACTPVTCNSGYYLSNGQCVVQSCTPNTTQSCVTADNFNGTKTCNSQGSAYGSCVSNGTCINSCYQNGNQCVPKVCTPSSSTNCSVTNGTGSKTCNSSGSSYGSCTPVSCNSGYYLNNGQCVIQSCTPNSTASCVTADNFNGTKTCTSTGSGYGSCVSTGTCVNSCYLSGNQCIPQVCTPNSTTTCSSNNGTGTKTCNSSGSAYGSCIVTTCNSGYSLVNGVCTVQTCMPNSSTSCTISNGTGSKTCNSTGTSYGSCSAVSCDPNYDRVVTAGSVWTFCSNEYEDCKFKGTVNVQYGKNGTFIEKPITNGTYCGNEVFTDPVVGTVKECNVKGTFSCQLRQCSSGQYDNGTSCVPQVCTPNSTSSCSVSNGAGSKTCNSTGSAYGSCTTVSCNAGYNLINGSCVINPDYCTNGQSINCSSTNGTGIKTCTGNSISNSVCVTNSCNSGYYLSGGLCIPQVCTPNSTKTCTSNNFNGTQTCNSSGSSYGSCITNGSCISGYSLSGSQCLPQVCTPHSTSSCTVSNGVGTKTCASNGLSYGSCVTSSCNAGYNLSNGACVLNPDYCSNGQTQSCSVTNGSGTKTCSSNSWSTSTCVGNSCNHGYYLSNGSCLPQVCSPNSTTSCSVSGNFNGTKTCNSSGSSYGSCTSTGSCLSGYYLNNGSCLPQVCSPNTSASCSVSNGIGSKMCNSNGSAYGSCNVISCNSGYSLINGQCSTTTCSVPNGSGTLTAVSTNNKYSINHQLTNDWITGYSYLLQIVNNSGSSLNDWSVCFDYNYNVGNGGLWNSHLSCQYDKKPYWKLEPESFNKIIHNGSNTTITWNGYPGNVSNNSVTNIRLFNSSNASCNNSKPPIWTSSGHYCKATSCSSGYTLVNNECQKNH